MTTTFTREQLNTLATTKLAQIQTQYRTMQQHNELRTLVGAKSFESVHNVMKRHALNLAKIELMSL
jgi:hypothetical protein